MRRMIEREYRNERGGRGYRDEAEAQRLNKQGWGQ